MVARGNYIVISMEETMLKINELALTFVNLNAATKRVLGDVEKMNKLRKLLYENDISGQQQNCYRVQSVKKFFSWFEPAWEQIEEDQKLILKGFYMDGFLNQTESDGFRELSYFSESTINRYKEKAISNLVSKLFNIKELKENKKRGNQMEGLKYTALSYIDTVKATKNVLNHYNEMEILRETLNYKENHSKIESNLAKLEITQFFNWFEPAWNSLTEHEKEILKAFYLSGKSKKEVVKELKNQMEYTEKEITNQEHQAFYRLVVHLYGRYNFF